MRKRSLRMALAAFGRPTWGILRNCHTCRGCCLARFSSCMHEHTFGFACCIQIPFFQEVAFGSYQESCKPDSPRLAVPIGAKVVDEGLRPLLPHAGPLFADLRQDVAGRFSGHSKGERGRAHGVPEDDGRARRHLSNDHLGRLRTFRQRLVACASGT